MNTFRFHCNPNNYTYPLDPNNHINQVIVILNYYLYKCMCGLQTQYKW